MTFEIRCPQSTAAAEMLISSRLSEPQLHRIARNLYGASVRMKELLDEVLTRYRGTNRGVEPSDLRELVTSAVDQVALVAEAQSVQIVENIARGPRGHCGPSAHPASSRQLVHKCARCHARRRNHSNLGDSLNAIPFWSRFAIPGRGSIPSFATGSSNHLRPRAKRMASAWALLFHDRPCLIMAGKCGWNRPARAPALRSVCRAVGARRKHYCPKLWARRSVPSRTRRTGGALSRDCLSGSSDAKESAILMISSWAR